MVNMITDAMKEAEITLAARVKAIDTKEKFQMTRHALPSDKQVPTPPIIKKVKPRHKTSRGRKLRSISIDETNNESLPTPLENALKFLAQTNTLPPILDSKDSGTISASV